MNWDQVTKDEFFKRIGPLDVHPHIVGRDSLFQSPDRQTYGKIENGKYPEPNKYFLPGKD